MSAGSLRGGGQQQQSGRHNKSLRHWIMHLFT